MCLAISTQEARMTSRAWERLIGWCYLLPHRDSLSPSRMGGPALFSWLVGSGRGEVILGAPQGEEGEGAI